MILIHLTMKMMRCLLLLILLFIPTILAQDAAHTRYICEHKAPQQVSCPPHYVIDVIDAFYGRLEKNRCRWNDNDHCRAPNSRSIIEGNCQDKMSCVLRAHNDVFGDPCVSVTKYVKIEYNCIITVDCGFESATEPFCNYENVGWERSSRGIPKGGKHFLAKYSYIPEATLTLKANTTEELELSFWFWRQTEGDYTFRLIQISGSIEDELWRQQNKEATSYEQVNGIKVKKGAILKLIATGNAVIYLDKIASVATAPKSTTAANTPRSTTSSTTAATTPRSTTAATTPRSTTSSTTSATTSATTPIPTTSSTTLISTTAATTPISTTAATTPRSTTAATTPRSTTAATTPRSTIAATTPISTTPRSTTAATTPRSTTAATTPRPTIAATTPISTTPRSTTAVTTPRSTTPTSTTSSTTLISTTAATTPRSTTAATTPRSTTSSTTPIPTASSTTLISTTAATTPRSTTTATTPRSTTAATTPISTTPRSTTAMTTPTSTTSSTTLISTTAATTLISTTAATTPTSTIPISTTSATTPIWTIPISTTSTILIPNEIEKKIKDLESIVFTKTSLTKEDSTKVVEVLGNLNSPGKNYRPNTTQKLLRILDQVADKVNVSDGEVFNATTPNVFVAVVNLPEANSTNGGDVYGVELSVVNHLATGFSNESFSLHYEEKDTNQSNIFIPYEVINKSKDGKVSFYSFLGDSFSHTNASTNTVEEDTGFEESFVNSHVILSATILDPEVSTENLTEKIKLSFRVNENTSIFGSSFCGFWVEDGSYWSSKGCTKLPSSEQLLRCECNHLTNFASLFAYGNLTHDKGLDILTYVGCSISAIASLLMIIALLILWKSTKVQMRQTTKFVMLNLSFSLFLLNILILISEIPGVRSDEGKCKAAAGTLHFALISAFLWMFAQAVPVFISIIKPMYFRVHFSSKKFVISFLFLGWGLPLVLVVLIGSLKPEWYVNQVNDVNPDKTPKIQGQFRCWIVPDMMIYLVIIPAAVLLSLNFLLFVLAIIKYLLLKRPGEKSSKRREGQLKTNLKFSVTLFVMFGITWIFGFLIFNSSDVSLAFAYIFTIFNSLQGFALFIIFIRRKGMKQNLEESLLKLTSRPSAVSNSRVTEERTFVTFSNTTQA
ncbi:uncharacterized protein LOC143468475 isoform X2 [Clavelina lepadiformis]|uniref:uncharacterized protein LOC143468475 isoform X2 n=1 Tax=Clavelina lepadiformis TaxID=159417 RepID=UPI004041F17D